MIDRPTDQVSHIHTRNHVGMENLHRKISGLSYLEAEKTFWMDRQTFRGIKYNL